MRADDEIDTAVADADADAVTTEDAKTQNFFILEREIRKRIKDRSVLFGLA